MHTPLRDRLWAALGTAIIVALLGYALVLGLTVKLGVRRDEVLALLTLRAPPSPPHPKPIEHPRTARSSGKASPRNLRNKATPVVALPPIVRLPPPPPPILTAPMPGAGMAASNGASDRPGPGQGAGGQGDGTGSGGSGNGDGDGGTPPRQTRGNLSFADLPEDLKRIGSNWSVDVRYTVLTDGHVVNCRVTRSNGPAELSDTACRLIEARFRFKPSLDGDGRPVQSIVVENHSWSYDREDDEPAGR